MDILTKRHKTVPVGDIQLHPRNVREGDVGAIAASLETHGQYRPVVVQETTGYILAGNHTYKAALALGWDRIAATYIDVSDEEAVKIMLVDNRTNDLATYDDHALSDLLTELASNGGLEGSGYSGDDLDELLTTLNGPAVSPDERYTPAWIFEAMDVEFDVDLAAPEGGIDYIPAKKYFTEKDDALTQDWTGLFAWCNPPYSIAADFGEKWIEEVAEGVWLGPQSNAAYRLRLMRASDRIALTSNLDFEYDGEMAGIRWPVFMAGIGKRGALALESLAIAHPDKFVTLAEVSSG